MLIAFPDDDEPRRRVADFLREAQRLLGGSEIDSAMLQVRKALETIKNTSGWNWPGKKDKPDRTVDERWALIRAAMEDQASGAMHVDPGTRDLVYTRAFGARARAHRQRQLAKAQLSGRPRSAVPMTLRYRHGPSLRTRSRSALILWPS